MKRGDDLDNIDEYAIKKHKKNLKKKKASNFKRRKHQVDAVAVEFASLKDEEGEDTPQASSPKSSRKRSENLRKDRNESKMRRVITGYELPESPERDDDRYKRLRSGVSGRSRKKLRFEDTVPVPTPVLESPPRNMTKYLDSHTGSVVRTTRGLWCTEQIDTAGGGTSQTDVGGCYSLIAAGSSGSVRLGRNIKWTGFQLRYNVEWHDVWGLGGATAQSRQSAELFVVIDNDPGQKPSVFDYIYISDIYPLQGLLNFGNMLTNMDVTTRFRCIKRVPIICPPNVYRESTTNYNIGVPIPMAAAPLVTFGPSVANTITSTETCITQLPIEYRSLYIPLDEVQSFVDNTSDYHLAKKQLLVFAWGGGDSSTGIVGPVLSFSGRLYFEDF